MKKLDLANKIFSSFEKFLQFWNIAISKFERKHGHCHIILEVFHACYMQKEISQSLLYVVASDITM